MATNKPRKPKYQVSLRLGDKLYETSGNSIVEAIEQIRFEGFIKTKALFTVTDGERKAERLLNIIQMKKLFMNKLFRQIFEKNMLILMR